MLNVALIGTGVISEWFVNSAKSVEGLKIGAVYGRDLEKAQAFARTHEIGNAYSDLGILLGDDKINTIYIGLPNSFHFEVALKSLQAKKNVIVEKPFTSNMAEYIQLIQASLDNKVRIFEMDRVLQLPNYQIIKDHLKDIAPIRAITCNYSQYSRKYDDLLAGNIRNVFSDEYSGGALVDLGVYGIHLVAGLFGAPQKIIYEATQLPNTIDTSGNLILKYEGLICSLFQSKNSKADNRITIQGEKGTITIHSVASRLEKVELDSTEKKEIGLVQENDGMAYTLREIVRIINHDDEKAYEAQLEHIQTVMSILDEARKSAGIIFKADKQKKKHWYSRKPKKIKVEKVKEGTKDEWIEILPKEERKQKLTKKEPKAKPEKKTKK